MVVLRSAGHTLSAPHPPVTIGRRVNGDDDGDGDGAGDDDGHGDGHGHGVAKGEGGTAGESDGGATAWKGTRGRNRTALIRRRTTCIRRPSSGSR
jgi:hypothetical protein